MKRLPLRDVDEACPLTVYWDPIQGTAGRHFLMTVRQTDDDGHLLQSPPLFLTWAYGEAMLAYSEPESRLSFPEAVLFSPVTQCNLNCIYCISEHTRHDVSVFSDAAWAEIVAAVAARRLRHLRSDYSGDLLFSDRRHGGWLDRVMALDIPFAIDTHANDLGADCTERLLRSRLFSINFSIDSLDPEDYPRIRRGARPLVEVLANIRQFMAERNAQRPDIETILSFVLMRRNLDSLAPAIDLAAELRLTAVIGNHLHAYTSDMAEESLMLHPMRYQRAFTDFIAQAQEKGVRLGLPTPVRASTARRGHAPCPYPWSTMVILGNGDVMGCCVPGTRVGTLREGSIEEIWRSDAMRQFRARVNTDDPPDACSVCPMKRFENNFASYVPGLPEPERQEFERRCVEAIRRR